jgi:hypothetical protein
MLVCVLVFLYNARPSTLEFNIQIGGFTMKLMKLNLLGPSLAQAPFKAMGEALKKYSLLSLIFYL